MNKCIAPLCHYWELLSNPSYPSCACVKAHAFAPFCSHCTHSVTLDRVQKLHKHTRRFPHTCLTAGDSAIHFSTPPPPPPPHPSCKSVNMACSGKHIHSIQIHPVTLGSVPEITPTHQGCSPHMSHCWGLSHTFFNPPPPPPLPFL